MKRIFFLAMISICLSGDISTEGEFFAQLDEEFSIVISTRTLSKDLGTSGSVITMGTFTVTINDSTTTPNGVNQVKLYSTITDPDDSSVVQIMRQTPKPSTRIDMTVTDDRNINGALIATNIDNNQSIRNRIRELQPVIVDEVHTLTLEAQSHNGSLQGNYRTTIYFQLVGP